MEEKIDPLAGKLVSIDQKFRDDMQALINEMKNVSHSSSIQDLTDLVTQWPKIKTALHLECKYWKGI